MKWQRCPLLDERRSFSQGLCRKRGRGRDSERTAPCSPHAVVISLCGGELYCFPLVLSQSNNLLCCPRSLPSDSFMYDCYVYGRFWSISAMYWMGEPAVCQPSGYSSSRQHEGGWSSSSWSPKLDGWRPVARTASSYWCHRGFSGINTLRMCAWPWLFVSVGQQRDAIPSEHFWRLPFSLCPDFSPRLAAVH